MAQAGLGWRVPYGAGNAEQTGRELPAPVAAPLLPAGCERNCCRRQQPLCSNPDPWPWLSTTRPQASRWGLALPRHASTNVFFLT